jgi:hypothetical protein
MEDGKRVVVGDQVYDPERVRALLAGGSGAVGR